MNVPDLGPGIVVYGGTMFAAWRERVRKYFEIRLLAKKLDTVLGQFDNLVAFNVAAGDHRYEILWIRTDEVVSELESKYGFERNDIMIQYPKLDQVNSYRRASRNNMGEQIGEAVKAGLPYAVVGCVVFSVGLAVLQAIHHDTFVLLTRWVERYH
jgi:hypothetical protein